MASLMQVPQGVVILLVRLQFPSYTHLTRVKSVCPDDNLKIALLVIYSLLMSKSALIVCSLTVINLITVW